MSQSVVSASARGHTTTRGAHQSCIQITPTRSFHRHTGTSKMIYLLLSTTNCVAYQPCTQIKSALPCFDLTHHIMWRSSTPDHPTFLFCIKILCSFIPQIATVVPQGLSNPHGSPGTRWWQYSFWELKLWDIFCYVDNRVAKVIDDHGGLSRSHLICVFFRDTAM